MSHVVEEWGNIGLEAFVCLGGMLGQSVHATVVLASWCEHVPARLLRLAATTTAERVHNAGMMLRLGRA